MRLKSILTALLLLVAGLQTVQAQKVVLYRTGGQTIEYDVSELDSIVFVEKKAKLVTKIELSEIYVSLQPDETKDLIATVLPLDADNRTVTWESSNEDIAEVSKKGKVIANAEGSCTITCSAIDGSGVRAECQVRVSKDNSGSINGRDYVDLGLPSGTLWATCNVGASKPEEYGNYFSWGETTAKSNYFSWDTYKYCEGSEYTLTKYCQQSSYGNNSFTDTLTELLPEDDAATAIWGNGWQMPSLEQCEELINSSYTTTKWMKQNGVKGLMITSKSNGNTIFLPAAGFRYDTSLGDIGSGGHYWPRSLGTSDFSPCACSLYFYSSFIGTNDYYRCCGLSVRPVRKK
jgi:hypothetical protein